MNGHHRDESVLALGAPTGVLPVQPLLACQCGRSGFTPHCSALLGCRWGDMQAPDPGPGEPRGEGRLCQAAQGPAMRGQASCQCSPGSKSALGNRKKTARTRKIREALAG